MRVSRACGAPYRAPAVPQVGSRAIMLPPRNYKLVSEDGRVLKKDNFEPMSFGMRTPPIMEPQSCRRHSLPLAAAAVRSTPARARRARALRFGAGARVGADSVCAVDPVHHRGPCSPVHSSNLHVCPSTTRANLRATLMSLVPQVIIIAYTVPRELCKASELTVSFAPRQERHCRASACLSALPPPPPAQPHECP